MTTLIDQNGEPATANAVFKFEEPELAFTHFFETFHLNEAKEQLNRARKIVREKKLPCKPGNIAEENMELFFEKLELVIAAAWKLR